MKFEEFLHFCHSSRVFLGFFMLFYFAVLFFFPVQDQTHILCCHKYELHYFSFYKATFWIWFPLGFVFQLSLVTNIGNSSRNPSSPVLYYVSGMSDLLFQRWLQTGHHAVEITLSLLCVLLSSRKRKTAKSKGKWGFHWQDFHFHHSSSTADLR